MFSRGGAFSGEKNGSSFHIIEVFSLNMDQGNSLDSQVSPFMSESTGDELEKVENWLREKHDGLFLTIINNDANNRLSIQCYCKSTFVVGYNHKNFLQSNFIKHKKFCPAYLKVDETKLARKRSADALEYEFSTVLSREELYVPSNNLSRNLSLSNPPPLATVISQNIVGEVRIFSYSTRQMKI